MFNTTESQLPAEFPAEGKFKELNEDMRLIRFEKFFKIHLIVGQKALIGCLVKMLKGKGVETFCILHASDAEPKPYRAEPNKLFMEL